MSKLEIKSVSTGNCYIDDDGLAIVYFGSNRVSDDFFEFQRILDDDPSEDDDCVYLLNGDFTHAARISNLSVSVGNRIILIEISPSCKNEFDGIEQVVIHHQVDEEMLSDIIKVLEILLRGPGKELRVEI
ncbi:hypothetical protein [Microbulbifer sp. ZKSA002]|uniref:hypothetical protein n=1 Tax=Microbulbifer sp. ZKSA002 TaxID=3243388 RepID=UPI004038FFD4